MTATINSAAPVADLIFVDGRVHTVDPTDRVTGALAVRGGRVLATGETAAIRRLAGRDTVVVDLFGRSLVPGFIDNHIHMSNATQRAWIDVSYPACRSIGQIVDAVAARARSATPGTWLLARGFDPARLREGREPTRLDLDDAIPDHPVGIANREGMGWTFNTAGLRRIGVTDTTPDPPGGPMARDAQGLPLGPMWDNARTVFINPNLPAPDLPAQAEAYASLARDLNALGVTTAYEAAYRRAIDAAAWRRVQAEAQPTLRVALGPYPLHGDHWDERGIAGTVAASGLSSGFGDEWLRLGSLQLGIDGGIFGRTAALLAPYADDPGAASRGSFRVSEETLAAAIARAFDADWQVGLICQGDAGIERALGALTSAVVADPRRDRHARLEHAYLWNPPLMDRAAELGVTWNTQPGILAIAGPAATLRAWGDRARWAFPFRSLLERGVPISSGSDWGVGPLDPIAALDALVTHRFGPGDGNAALNPDEAITISQAIRIMTLGSARAGLLDDELGSLEAGKQADVAVLSGDLTTLSPSAVRSLRVDETWLAGRRVFRREPEEGRPA